MAGVPKLIVLSEQFRGRTFELNKEQLTVGRVDERDICIKDSTISTYHCKFVRSGNTFTVIDQGSTNGTRVNNVPVTNQELQNSDIIQVGGVELLYDCDDKSMTTMVTQTQTNININAGGDTTQTFRNIERKVQERKSSGIMQQKILLGIIVLLVLFVVALLAFLIIKVFAGKNTEAASLERLPVISRDFRC